MTYRFPAVLCSRVSFRLSVRLVVSRVILRGSTSYCFSHCPIRAYIVNVALVDVGTNEKLVLALCPAHDRFIADFVGLLRRNLTGRERLPDLKEQGPALHGPACFRLVLAFRQKKLSGGGCRIAEVGRHSSYLFRIESVGKPILHCLNSSFSRRYLVGPDVGCSRNYHLVLPLYKQMKKTAKFTFAVYTLYFDSKIKDKV